MYYLKPLCSTCLTYDKKLVNLKDLGKGITEYYEKFVFEKVSKNSDFLCDYCYSKLQFSYKFWQQCQINKQNQRNYVFLLTDNSKNDSIKAELSVDLSKQNFVTFDDKVKIEKPIEGDLSQKKTQPIEQKFKSESVAFQKCNIRVEIVPDEDPNPPKRIIIDHNLKTEPEEKVTMPNIKPNLKNGNLSKRNFDHIRIEPEDKEIELKNGTKNMLMYVEEHFQQTFQKINRRRENVQALKSPADSSTAIVDDSPNSMERPRRTERLLLRLPPPLAPSLPPPTVYNEAPPMQATPPPMVYYDAPPTNAQPPAAHQPIGGPQAGSSGGNQLSGGSNHSLGQPVTQQTSTERGTTENGNIMVGKRSRASENPFSRENCKRNTSPQEYLCKFCQGKFSRYTDMKKHEKLHYEYRRHCCGICQKYLYNDSNLKRHMKIHSNKSYECYICKVVFQESETLAYHLSIHRTTQKFTSNKEL